MSVANVPDKVLVRTKVENAENVLLEWLIIMVTDPTKYQQLVGLLYCECPNCFFQPLSLSVSKTENPINI